MLDSIRRPVEKEMEEFNRRLACHLHNDNPSISSVLDYVFEKKGKQMRPLLVMLTAALHGGINDRTYSGAMLAELVHTASLIHDDIVDDAYVRRGSLSANAIWRSKVAVLTGDYVLSRAISAAVKNGAADLLSLIIDSFEMLSEGELIQLEHASKLDTDEKIYFETINKKTASLLGSCAALGARSAAGTEEQVESMRRFGEYLGMAFQIKDDILDFSTGNKTGKPGLQDIRERKITLPLLILLNDSGEKKRKKIISLLSGIRYKDANAEIIHSMIMESGALVRATVIMEQYIDKARIILESYEDSEIKESLRRYTSYIMDRDR
ncbi:MAG: polyprenyl synthetase family protein [Rikenellaceae bacterium]|nr:polyprenyl synthetase family protein [Rikenellaceae bacterium]